MCVSVCVCVVNGGRSHSYRAAGLCNGELVQFVTAEKESVGLMNREC